MVTQLLCELLVMWVLGANMYDTILIATDGSDASEAAVQYGIDMAETTGASVHALYVVETKATYILTVGLSDEQFEEYEAYGTDVVTAVADRAADRGLTAAGAVKSGRPDEKIVEYADKHDIDLIVIAKQGHGAIEQHLGGTTESVMWLSETPVTVVTGN